MNRRHRHLLGRFWLRNLEVASLIKSVQAGTITIATSATSNTGTITAVDPDNAIVLFGGFSTTANYGPDNYFPNEYEARVALTNSTTVTALRNTSNASFTVTASYTVVEFAPGVIKSVQRGTITFSSGSSATATITSVDTAKAWVMFLGYTTQYSNGGNPANNLSPITHKCRVALDNATTVRLSTDAVNGDVTGGYQVVEFY